MVLNGGLVGLGRSSNEEGLKPAAIAGTASGFTGIDLLQAGKVRERRRNPARSLKNGRSKWVGAGFQLEHAFMNLTGGFLRCWHRATNNEPKRGK